METAHGGENIKEDCRVAGGPLPDEQHKDDREGLGQALYWPCFGYHACSMDIKELHFARENTGVPQASGTKKGVARNRKAGRPRPSRLARV